MVKQNIHHFLTEIEADLVLDAATGRGEFINYIKHFKHFGKIIAIDIEAKSKEYLEKNFPDQEVKFIRMDAHSLDFRPEYFDAVCLSNSLHHLDQPQKILQNLYQVLKKDGYFIVQEMYRDDLTEAQNSHVLLHHWSAKLDRLKGKTHNETFKRSEIVELFSTINLQKRNLIDHTYPLENPKDEKLLAHYTKMIEKMQIRAENDHPLKRELAKIKAHILQYGYAPANSLFLIGRK